MDLWKWKPTVILRTYLYVHSFFGSLFSFWNSLVVLQLFFSDKCSHNWACFGLTVFFFVQSRVNRESKKEIFGFFNELNLFIHWINQKSLFTVMKVPLLAIRKTLAVCPRPALVRLKHGMRLWNYLPILTVQLSYCKNLPLKTLKPLKYKIKDLGIGSRKL